MVMACALKRCLGAHTGTRTPRQCGGIRRLRKPGTVHEAGRHGGYATHIPAFTCSNRYLSTHASFLCKK